SANAFATSFSASGSAAGFRQPTPTPRWRPIQTRSAYHPRLASSRQPAGIATERERAMHLQMRTAPVSSPPDVELLLRRLKDDGVDLQAVGGSDVEFGGEIALVPKDGHEDQARTTLQRFKYP